MNDVSERRQQRPQYGVDDEDEGFVRPRYLLVFASTLEEVLARQVCMWLENAGLSVALDCPDILHTRPVSLVVSASRELLEVEAERQGYLKSHKALQPHVRGQCLGKIEFEREPLSWVEGYEGYHDANFWLPSERLQLLRSLLERVPTPSEFLALHLPSLLKQQRKKEDLFAFTSSFLSSLHVTGLLVELLPLDDGTTDRMTIWNGGRFCRLWPMAPVTAIQEYFGTNVAMYFAWMNSYTKWLVAPAGLGLACWLHKNAYGYSIDNHPYLPLYSVFVVFWGVAFMCNWERTVATRAWKWNVYGAEQRRAVRLEFIGELRKSPITGDCVRKYPYWKRLVAYLVSSLVTSLMLSVAFFAMICSMNLQGYMQEHVTALEKLFYIKPLADFAQPGAVFDPDQERFFGLLAFAPTLMHVVVITQLNKAYRRVAEWLTSNENHQLEHEHENALIGKRVFFEAFDCYIALFYVGFVLQDLRKLRRQLTALYTMDSIRRALLETLLPLGIKIWRKRKHQEKYIKRKKSDHGAAATRVQAPTSSCLKEEKEEEDHLEQVEAAQFQSQCDQPVYDRFDDFLEMVIEFGYVTLFASAFPLAGAITIPCNLIELKSDLFKLTWVYRRPLPERAATIGAWKRVLRVIVGMSVLTNMMLFSMSEQIASWFPSLYREATQADVIRGRLAHAVDASTGHHELVIRRGSSNYVLLIAFSLEHFVFLSALLLALLIPQKPEWVRNEIARLVHYNEKQMKALRKKHFAADAML